MIVVNQELDVSVKLFLYVFVIVSVQKDTHGQELFNEVCQQLDLIEKDYFGLRFVDIEKQRVSACCQSSCCSVQQLLIALCYVIICSEKWTTRYSIEKFGF